MYVHRQLSENLISIIDLLNLESDMKKGIFNVTRLRSWDMERISLARYYDFVKANECR